MRYIQGIDRNQTTLLPETVDDYIKEDSPVRFIDVYVDNLDLVKMDFTYAETKETGRKPYSLPISPRSTGPRFISEAFLVWSSVRCA